MKRILPLMRLPADAAPSCPVHQRHGNSDCATANRFVYMGLCEPLSTGGPPLLGGISVSSHLKSLVRFDGNGHMSVSLANNSQVLPLPSQWKINVVMCKEVIRPGRWGSISR